MRLILGTLAVLAMAGASLAAEMGDDGLHKADWMRDTFKDLQEDFEEAKSEGKKLLLLVEQRGCLYCRDMHENTFTDPRIDELLRDDFFVVQLNLHGDIEIIDTDGEELSEKQAMRKWGILFTPTMVFLPAELDDSQAAQQQAAAIMPGAFAPGTTLDMMTWVKEERYLDVSEEDFQRYHARMVQERNDGDTR
ncbi:thioredoxin family protein [Ruegeria conchae]|uniref:thioredoxin family protein n=1 Tax=Ruegeria conchae TaxID=981384 RepID=UPI0029C661C0|nr:thioredoxin family protein [Ruegeria conchae]